MTAAALVHVRTALGDKAFEEASSRGLALTLGDAVAYAEKQVREALAKYDLTTAEFLLDQLRPALVAA